MRRCEAITKGGTRCQAKAMHSYEHCYLHRPDLADERKRNASRGGKAAGRGRSGGDEVDQAKRWVKGLISKMLRGEVDRDVAATAFMGINTLARLVDLERRIVEQDEIIPRIEQLEADTGGSRSTWHR